MATYTGFGLPEDLLEQDAPVLVLAVQSRENFEAESARAAANPTPPMSRVRMIDGAKCRTREGFAAELNRAYQDSLDASRGERFGPNWNIVADYLRDILVYKDGFEVLTILDGEQLFADERDDIYRFVRGVFQFRDWPNTRNLPPLLVGPPLRWVVQIRPESYSSLSRFLMAGLDQECPTIRLSLRDLPVGGYERSRSPENDGGESGGESRPRYRR